MKISSLLKVGTFTVIVILVSWWGIKWLGGQNILHSDNIYYVYYDDVSGLQESSRVKLRGVEVGNVRSIELMDDKVMVEIAIEDKYAEMVARQEVRDVPLKAAHKMVQEKNEEVIRSYLSDNYIRNCELAKFCIK